VKELKTLTRDTIVKFFDDYIALGGNRRKLSVQVYGKQHKLPTDSEIRQYHTSPPAPVRKAETANKKPPQTLKSPNGPIEVPAFLANLPPQVMQQIVAANGGGNPDEIELAPELVSQLESALADGSLGDIGKTPSKSSDPIALQPAPVDHAPVQIIREGDETRFKRSMPLFPATFLPFQSSSGEEVLIFHC